MNQICTIFKEQKYNDMWMNNKSEPCYFYEYHPWHGGTNSEWYQPTDGKILDVKDQYLRGINHFTPKLEIILSRTDYVICVIPSSKVGTMPSGIRSIAKRLCVHPVIDGTDVLYRAKELPDKAETGIRDYELEYESLEVRNESLIRNKQILLLDDITTSGVSFDASKKVLEEAGAYLVVPFALGKTV